MNTSSNIHDAAGTDATGTDTAGTKENAAKPAAVVLLSGGLDSAVTLAVARNEGYAVHAISFDYGQRHRIELTAAANVAKHLGVQEHRTVRIDSDAFGGFGGSALVNASNAPAIDVPKDRDVAHPDGEIPVTYVPARNTIFLSYALGLAEVSGSGAIFIGVNAVDYSGYPDCRPAFIEAFGVMANLATKAGVEGRPLAIHTPLIDLSKVQIIELGLKQGVDFSLTHSCYDPVDDKACRHCDSCLLRQAAFAELGMTDPALSV